MNKLSTIEGNIYDESFFEGKSQAYKMGYDCEFNGANTTNSHFSLFATEQLRDEWEQGKKDAQRTKAIINL